MKKLISAFTAAAIVLSGISITPVFAAESYIKNGDFSQGGNEWHGEGSGTCNQTIEKNIAEISSTGLEYEYRLSQTVELPNGTYDLKVKAAVDNIEGIYYVYAKTDGHTMVSTSIPQGKDMYGLIVPGVIVENGRCDVGVYAKGESTVKVADFSLEKTDESTRLPFLKGGEISKLTYVEDMGGKFYRADGTEGDALQIMAENGSNLARIRVLNDPGKGHGDGTYYLPEGYQDLDDCLKLARRAKDKGMQIEFTFAYSDYWVDGDKQFIPHEWQEYIDNNKLTGTAKYNYLENKVYEYTKDVMQKLIEQGTCPDFVSIGNEMQCGLFFNDAKKDNYKGDLYYDKPMLLKFINAGAKAVRETAPDAKVVIHTDNGGKVFDWLNSNWDATAFQYLLKRADYDVMAVSYYPYYNGNISIDNIVTEFNKCVKDLNKDVMIMETGYNFAEKRSDGYEGQLQDNGFYQDIYGETILGQKAYLTELYAKLKTVAGGRCIGVSYWDPVMITDKVGWAISEDGDWLQGNVITNSTIFDFDGKSVAGQLAMKYNTNATDKILISGKAEKNSDFDLKVNGNTMSVRADKYGDYIAAVDYPSDGRLSISANGTGYSVDAPYDGVLVTDIDFVYKNELKAENGLARADFSADIDSDEQMLGLIVKYDDDERITGVKTAPFIPNTTKTVFAEIRYDGKDNKIKSFLWEASDMIPVTEAKSIIIK